MTSLISIKHRRARLLGSFLCLSFLVNVASAKDALVAKWARFEQTFKSSANYENPLQQCTLKVIIVSPSGATNVIDGFWDGGKTWRVRFSPDQLGYWTFHTECSDKTNGGLNNQSGKFLCTSPIGDSRFAKHGPV